MRPARVLWPLFVLTGAACVIAALLLGQREAARLGSIALVLLAGCLAFPRATGPARARGLIGGIAVFALAWAMDFWWSAGSAGDVDRSGAAEAPGTPPAPVTAGHWTPALGYLLALLALAIALMVLPRASAAGTAGTGRRPHPARTTLVVAAAVLLLGVVAAPVAAGLEADHVGQVWASAWPAFLLTVAAFGTVVAAGRHADRSWLVPTGAVLLQVWAALSLYQSLGEWVAWPARSIVTGARGTVVSTAEAVSSTVAVDVVAGLAAACALAGAAALALGALRAERRPLAD